MRLSGHWEAHPALNLGEYTPGEAGSCLDTSTEGSGRSQSQVRAQVRCVPPLCGSLAHEVVPATRLSEQHRVAQACDSNAGPKTMWFRDFFEIQVTALSPNSTG